MLFLLMIETEEDRRKFMILYEKYEHMMFWVAYKIVEDRYMAEDIVHDVFEKVANNMQCIDEPISKRTRRYLHTVTRNKAIDQLRKERRRNYIDYVPLEDVQIGKEQKIPLLEELDDEAIVMEALHRLPEEYTTLFVYKYVECMKYREIAERLDMKEGTVRQRIARGKVLLREELEKVRKEKEEE